MHHILLGERPVGPMGSGVEGETKQMESQPHPGGRDAPPQARSEEARLMVDRAERVWRRQIVSEEIPAPAGPRAAFRWVLLAIALGAIVFLMFARLGQIG
jgi:hypothetical protein